MKANYGRKGFCQSEEDTTEHVLECNKEDKKFNLNDERGKEWGEMVEIYRRNKENRSVDNRRRARYIRRIDEKRRQ